MEFIKYIDTLGDEVKDTSNELWVDVDGNKIVKRWITDGESFEPRRQMISLSEFLKKFKIKSKNIYIQRGYDGREKTGCVNYCNSTKNEDYKLVYIDSVSQITSKPECIIGSVEFIEQYIGPRTPDYYPYWAEEFLRRSIVGMKYPYWDSLLDEDLKTIFFLKPSDSYKRFDAFVFNINNKEHKEKYEKLRETPCHISKVVNFVDEWRYYVVNGEVVSSWWYQGSEETCEKNPNGPYLKMNIPRFFCGAIDMGMLDTGEFALVEVQHPYAIGWYGEQEDFENYLNFLIKGFKSL